MDKANSGSIFLKEYISNNNFSLLGLDINEFQQWLQETVEKTAQYDITFKQRCFIRDLKKKHHEEYFRLYENLKEAERTFANHINKPALEKIEHELDGTNKAISGLQNFLQKNRGDEERQQKLTDFENKRQQLEKELAELTAATPEKTQFLASVAQFEAFCEQIGLTAEEEKLTKDLKQQGQKRSFAGSQFEDSSGSVVQDCIVPILATRNAISAEEIILLSNVTLGCARAEIDYVAIQKTSADYVKVLAIIEVKKNINDIVGGFELRQENIHWFTGNQAGYDSEIYRTKVFRSGHFDTPATHEENGNTFVFSKESFQDFKLRGNYFLDQLFFITYDKKIIGLHADEKNLLYYRISTDISFDTSDMRYVTSLYNECKTRISPFQTTDVLRLYINDEELAKNIWIVPKKQHNETAIREQLAKEQEKLTPMVIIPEKDGYFPEAEDIILSFDIQYDGDEAHVAADMFSWKGKHIKTFTGLFRTDVPYVPTYFSFREGPPLLAIYHKIIQNSPMPNLLIIDGHGIAHPRKFGVACWLGVATGLPAIGCAKETLVSFDGDKLQDGAGDYVFMKYDNENLGYVVRRIKEVNPVFVSPGHLVSMEDSLKIVLDLEGEFKVPDTLRRADQACREHCLQKTGDWEDLGLLPKATPIWEI